MSTPDPPIALITGASAGLGAAFARRLAREGYRLILVARRRERLEALAQELARAHGTASEVLALDLALPSDLARAEERIARAPHPRLLVNNAGGLVFGAFQTLERDAEETLVRVHAIAPLRLSHAALPAMLAARDGAIIQVASRAAFRPSTDATTYAAAKAFLHRHALGLARALEGSGVRVVSVCPGNVRTELFERAGLEPAAIARLAMMEPDAVVDAALAALARGDELCVPGERASSRLLRRALPRRLLRRASGVLQRLAGA